MENNLNIIKYKKIMNNGTTQKDTKTNKKGYSQKELDVVFKCIKRIEGVLGGYNKSREIVSLIENDFGLEDSLAFKEACMLGRMD